MWGERICSYYSSEIDSLVDRDFGHDSSRYNIEVLERVVDIVVSRHGEGGLCYLVLHHYLDRLVDILVSTLSDYAFMDVFGPEAYEDVRSQVYNRLLHDPKNILSALISDDMNLQIRIGVSGSESLQRLKDRVGIAAQQVLKSIEGSLDCIIHSILIGDPHFKGKLTNAITLKSIAYHPQNEEWRRKSEELFYKVLMEACKRCLLGERKPWRAPVGTS